MHTCKAVPVRDRLRDQIRELVADAGGNNDQQKTASALATELFYAGAEHALAMLRERCDE